MRKILLALLAVALALAIAVPAAYAAPSSNAAASPDIEMGIFVDYQHDGNPPPAWDETEDDYRIRAGITWPDPSAVTYYVNPAGSGVTTDNDGNGINDGIDAVNAGLAEWQNGPSAWGVFTSFVAYAYGGTTTSTGASRDYTNTVSWESTDGPGGIIASCYYWYDKPTKTMLEFDIVFDSDDPWGIGTGNYYDIQNIATHEWGHTLKLFDLYAVKDYALTMYGWASKNDISKRDLGYGDALGVAELYPE